MRVTAFRYTYDMREFKWSCGFDGQRRRLYRVVCTHCTKDVWVPNYDAIKRKYCSKKCNGAATRTRVAVSCANCGEDVLRKPCKLSNKTGLHFCSRPCQDVAQKQDSGVAYTMSHYKGGVATYRQRALQEHGEQCNKCGYGATVKMLDVHHKDSNRDNNCLTNLEVLCVWCHTVETRSVDWHPWSEETMLMERN